MKIKNFMKHFKEGLLKYFKITMKFLNISKCTALDRKKVLITDYRWKLVYLYSTTPD